MLTLNNPVETFSLIGFIAVVAAGVAAGISWSRGYGLGYDHGRESLDIGSLNEKIKQLTAQLEEAREMARKPLTEDQLKTCFEAHGNECPRCGSNEISVDDLETSKDDSSLVCQTATCDDCQEQWSLYFKLEKVEPYED